MLLGSALPSPLPSAAWLAHDDGMNCIGPTARSQVVLPSYRPPSVSLIAAMCAPPDRIGPRIGAGVRPLASSAPPRACPDSTLPMTASTDQGRWQEGSVRLMVAAAAR